VLAHEADRMAVVDHRERVKLVREIADALEIRDVAVHGEHAVGRDEDLFAARPRARPAAAASRSSILLFL
jgi:hypothetical protein